MTEFTTSKNLLGILGCTRYFQMDGQWLRSSIVWTIRLFLTIYSQKQYLFSSRWSLKSRDCSSLALATEIIVITCTSDWVASMMTMVSIIKGILRRVYAMLSPPLERLVASEYPLYWYVCYCCYILLNIICTFRILYCTIWNTDFSLLLFPFSFCEQYHWFFYAIWFISKMLFTKIH